MLRVVCLLSLTATVVDFCRRWSLVQWGKLSALSKRKRPRLECLLSLTPLLSLTATVPYLEKSHLTLSLIRVPFSWGAKTPAIAVPHALFVAGG